MSDKDSFFALASAPGEAALALLRVNGSLVPAIMREALGYRDPLQGRRANYKHYTDTTGKVVDDLVAIYYPAGASFTGEHLLEITPHGNPLIVQQLMEDLQRRGLRQAEPGEFTRTAFLNGRLDLSQAEAIGDLIHARSERAIEATRRQMQGGIGEHMSTLSGKLLGVIAAIEAYIDFPEEDLPPEDAGGPLAELKWLIDGVNRLLATRHYYSVLHDGLKTLIVGAPNVGKSSLINALTGHRRAIVSEVPGTTRDAVSDRIMIGGHWVDILDTAGLRESEDAIECMGMAMTLELAAEADHFLLALDATLPPPPLPEAIANRMTCANTIVVVNKCDLPGAQSCREFFPDIPHVMISALTGDGIDNLRKEWQGQLEGRFAEGLYDGISVNARHAAALERARDAMLLACDKLRVGESGELAAAELREALDAFGEVVGKFDVEDMLDTLFKNFCIGK
jgi:tRNA modification GTPase